MNPEILLTFKTPRVNKITIHRIKIYVFQRKHGKTVCNGTTDYKLT